MGAITAFVLAGGRSRRMGADKALVDWHGRPLLARALELARSVTPSVRIVGSREKFAAHGEVVADVYTDRGPLGGIHAALLASATDLNLMLAVDMPFVEPGFLEYLVEQARAGAALVTVPSLENGWQPLCAVYRRAFAAVAEAALQVGRNKIDALFPAVALRIIEEKELRRLGLGPEMFDNLNTRAELEQARARQVRRT